MCGAIKVSRGYIYFPTHWTVDIPALETDSIVGQVLIEHKANKEVYVTQSGDFII